MANRPAVHRHREVDRLSQYRFAGIGAIGGRYPCAVTQVKCVDELVARLPEVLLALRMVSDGYSRPAVFTLGGGIDLSMP